MSVSASARVERQSRQMTYDEWLNCRHDGIAEWVNGEVITTPVTRSHQMIVEFLYVLLSTFLRRFKLGRVHTAPYPMRVTPMSHGREPDLIVVLADRLHLLTEQQLDGPADLVVEVVSQGSVYNDRVDKFQEYEQGGVREYWLIDSRADQRRADFYVRDQHGRFQSALIDADSVYRSIVLTDFWLNVDWLWSDTDPLAALDAVLASLKDQPE